MISAKIRIYGIGVYVFTVEGTRFLWWMGVLSSGGYTFVVEGTRLQWRVCLLSSGGYTFVVEDMLSCSGGYSFRAVEGTRFVEWIVGRIE